MQEAFNLFINMFMLINQFILYCSFVWLTSFFIQSDQACYVVLQSWFSKKFMTGWYGTKPRSSFGLCFYKCSSIFFDSGLTLSFNIVLQCGPFSCCNYIFYYMVVYSVRRQFLQSNICQTWHQHIW